MMAGRRERRPRRQAAGTGAMMAAASDPSGIDIAEKTETQAVAATPEPAVQPAAAVEPPKATRPAAWNPQGLTVPNVPKQVELFAQQFVPGYLKTSPAYLG